MNKNLIKTCGTAIKVILVLSLTFTSSTLKAQTTMRPIEQLTSDQSGWSLVKRWIDTAKNKVEILPADHNQAVKALYNTQVTTRSPMGAIIYFTGGLLVDNGWIRILGSGSTKISRSLPEWNKGKTFTNYGERPAFLLVADDAVGGYFAINGGSLGNDPGKVYYLAPNSLDWETLDLNYSEFLEFCFEGNLAKFYADVRWETWKLDITKISGDQVFNFYPYLWSQEGKDVNKDLRKIVPTEEQYTFNMDTRKQLGKN